MPLGCSTSPAVFECLIERVFIGLTYKSLLIYLDDIIVYGKTFETHFNNLDEVFQRLKKGKPKIEPRKMHFL